MTCVETCEIVPERYTTRYASAVAFGRVEEITEITGMEEDEIKTVSLFRREYGRGLQKTGELVHREKLEGKTG